ncbi:MAG: carbamoyltransferase HypF [Campylobacterales bacterium]|nr:carbamoyltransferase HypF [Campylobacterales bacterium]
MRSRGVKRVRITIRGIVQGVGFRPFIYRCAKRWGVSGYVTNTPEGVEIDAQGERLENFIEELKTAPPIHARIDALDTAELPPCERSGFEIRESQEGSSTAAIPQERAMCAACEAEFDDPNDRRYRYPFINCTDCGPRYTIMQIPPYDRVRTSMKHFAMCPECEAEYTDPSSRRYHAEPISCPKCGPRVRFLDPSGEEREGDPLQRAATMLKEGKIIALKGLGGFHLMCDATCDEAVGELRRRKRRAAKPLAVMFGSLEQLERSVRIGRTERELITGAIRPIVIADAREGGGVSSLVAPGIDRIGVLLPYTPLHALLFETIDFPLVATSANISDEPIIARYEEIVRRLGGVVDGILDHDRIIVNPLDDSVVQVAGEKTVMLRMGRGYAPHALPLSRPARKSILAVGAHQKSAVALAVGKNLILSPHIGDLGSIEADEYFERTVHTLKRFYRGKTDVMVHDPHPLYSSTRYAAEHAAHHYAVQHHYAHILTCMAEYGLTQKVLGFAFDGTGYGENGELWGGEVMIADVHTYERIGFIKPFALLGGDKAVREPRRIALSLLFERYSLEEVMGMQIPTTWAFLPHEIRQLHHMWSKKLNAPMSTSMGRLFDAVASLGGFVQHLDYEGQGGMIMERHADLSVDAPFAFEVNEGSIDPAAMIGEIVKLSSDPANKGVIAGRFLATVEAMIGRFADVHPYLPIVVGGGVFQNRALMERVYRRFADRPFFAQQRTPINDGGIALGQAWWGLHNS